MSFGNGSRRTLDRSSFKDTNDLRYRNTFVGQPGEFRCVNAFFFLEDKRKIVPRLRTAVGALMTREKDVFDRAAVAVVEL